MSSLATEALEEAAIRAGGITRLARSLGLSHVSVLRWRKRGQLPADRVLEVEALTGVPRDRLRPDLYAQPAAAPRPGLAETQAPFAAEAQALGLDAAAIAAQAVQEAIRSEKARRWLEENKEAIDAHNRWVEEHGLPLAEYRMF